MRLRVLFAVGALSIVATVGASTQSDVTAQVQAADKQLTSGDVAGAVAALEKIVAAAPKSFDARLSLGRALDLEGRHAAARVHLEEAVKLASDQQRNGALTSLGVSYAFESK